MQVDQKPNAAHERIRNGQPFPLLALVKSNSPKVQYASAVQNPVHASIQQYQLKLIDALYASQLFSNFSLQDKFEKNSLLSLFHKILLQSTPFHMNGLQHHRICQLSTTVVSQHTACRGVPCTPGRWPWSSWECHLLRWKPYTSHQCKSDRRRHRCQHKWQQNSRELSGE